MRKLATVEKPRKRPKKRLLNSGFHWMNCQKLTMHPVKHGKPSKNQQAQNQSQNSQTHLIQNKPGQEKAVSRIGFVQRLKRERRPKQWKSEDLLAQGL